MNVSSQALPMGANVATGVRWSPLELIGAALLGAVVFANNFNITLQATEGGDEYSVSKETLIRLGICAMCGLFGLFHLRTVGRQLFRFPTAWGTLFGLWCLVTVFATEKPAYVGASCLALWSIILFAPAILLRLGGRRVVLVILSSLVIYILASWALFFAMPEIGQYSDDPGGGLMSVRLGGDANQLALQCVWAIGMLLVLRAAGLASWRSLSPLLVLAMVTLYFTHGRTAMVGACALGALFSVRSIGRKPLLTLSCFGGALLAAAAMFVSFDSDKLAASVSRTGDHEEIYQLTGRTEIWDFAAEKYLEAPFFGFGHGAARYALADFRNSGYDYNDLHHAHNQLLNIMLCTGLVGGLLLVAMLGSQAYRILTMPDPFPDMVTVVVLVVGLVEVVLFGPMPRASTAIWLIALAWRQVGASLDDSQARNQSDLVRTAKAARAEAT